MPTDSPRTDRGDLLRALAVLCESPGPGIGPVAESLGLGPVDASDHTELFVHQLVPYASVYLDDEAKIGGEARDRIAGFWRALHADPPTEPDHLSSLLGLAAHLHDVAQGEADVQRRLLIAHTRRALVWEHLAAWLPPYLARVDEIGSVTFREWAVLVGRALLEECDEEMPGLPVHLRTAVSLDRDSVERQMLVPVRSGLIFTRSDLKRAAADLELGLRMGERAYILDALLRQNRPGVLGWLADEAARQSALWSRAPGPTAVLQHWSARAQHTATLLRAQTRGS